MAVTEKSAGLLNRVVKVLIADFIGMRFDANGVADHSETQAHIETKGGVFHLGSQAQAANLATGKLHFFYEPDLSTEQDFLTAAQNGQYDAVIAAASFIPARCQFELGGVRMGAGTGNMGSASWGGGNGIGGSAPLMNTPSFNAKATAQMVFKALLNVLPDLDVKTLHQRVVDGDFDTGLNLVEYPTAKLQSKTIAVLGYGNIGREVAKLAKAFGMKVVVYARARHKEWVLSEGFDYADGIIQAASNADVISPHLGLGAFDGQTQTFANAGIVDDTVLNVMNSGAVVINYDRGELVNIAALDKALQSGQVCYAAIDADIFKDSQTGELTGPMVPYLDIYSSHPDKMALLPHAAADTEHYSRVEGAKQAVDQIFDAINLQKVVNLKGDLPDGYTDGKALTVNGVGQVRAKEMQNLNVDEVNLIADMSGQLATFWQSIQTAQSVQQRDGLIDSQAAQTTKMANNLLTLLDNKGLLGPFEQ